MVDLVFSFSFFGYRWIQLGPYYGSESAGSNHWCHLMLS